MKDITEKNFGPLIAFCLPGFILLVSLSYSIPWMNTWLTTAAAKDGASIGGFLYSTLASLSLGLLLNGIRWATVDQFLEREHRIHGAELPKIDFGQLADKEKLAAFQGVVENHYRYYQYYSNSLVAVELAGATYLWNFGGARFLQWVLVLLLVAVLFAASRDCFHKYRIRGAAITARRGEDDERLGALRKEDGEEGKEDGEESSEENEEDGKEGVEEEGEEKEVKKT